MKLDSLDTINYRIVNNKMLTKYKGQNRNIDAGATRLKYSEMMTKTAEMAH